MTVVLEFLCPLLVTFPRRSHILFHGAPSFVVYVKWRRGRQGDDPVTDMVADEVADKVDDMAADKVADMVAGMADNDVVNTVAGA